MQNIFSRLLPVKKGDNIHRTPRLWSNAELRKYAQRFSGDIINVSAWKDDDKEGSKYKNYFTNASSYSVSNHNTDFRGAQGIDNEIVLDLEKDLPNNLIEKYDVVFNHTTLEHVYNFRKAFSNLCEMTKDILILVVPFIQQMHTNQGDYWRFSPEAISRMHEEEGMHILYLSFNNQEQSSVYIFSIATKLPQKWSHIQEEYSFSEKNPHSSVTQPLAGCNAILPR